MTAAKIGTVRLERRSVFGRLTDDYRLAVCRRASLADCYAGRAEGRPGAAVAWYGLTAWGTREAAEGRLAELGVK